MARPLRVEAQIGDYLNIHYATASRAVKRIIEEREGKV